MEKQPSPIIRRWWTLKVINTTWGPKRAQVWHVSLNHVLLNSFTHWGDPRVSQKRSLAFAKKLGEALKGADFIDTPPLDVARANKRLRTKGVID